MEMKGKSYFIKKDVLLKSIEDLKNNRSRLAYLVNVAESVERESVSMDPETQSIMYRTIAKEYLGVDDAARELYGEKLIYVFGDAADHFKKQGDKDRNQLFAELSEDAMSHSHRDRNAKKHSGLQSKVSQKLVAVLFAGGLIFAMRAMTGNVISSPTSIGGEIVGSLLVGILLVGIVWLVLSRLTAKP